MVRRTEETQRQERVDEERRLDANRIETQRQERVDEERRLDANRIETQRQERVDEERRLDANRIETQRQERVDEERRLDANRIETQRQERVDEERRLDANRIETQRQERVDEERRLDANRIETQRQERVDEERRLDANRIETQRQERVDEERRLDANRIETQRQERVDEERRLDANRIETQRQERVDEERRLEGKVDIVAEAKEAARTATRSDRARVVVSFNAEQAGVAAPRTVIRPAADSEIRRRASEAAERLLHRAVQEEKEDVAEPALKSHAWEQEVQNALLPKIRAQSKGTRKPRRNRQKPISDTASPSPTRALGYRPLGTSEIIEFSNSESALGISLVGKLDVGPATGWIDQKSRDESWLAFEGRVAIALMKATGLRVPVHEGRLKDTLSAGMDNVLVREPILTEGGAVAKPDFVLVQQGVVEVFEATLNSTFSDTKKTFPQKLTQFATVVPALARMFPHHRIVYSFVTPRALTSKPREMVQRELKLRGHTSVPVQVIWRKA